MKLLVGAPLALMTVLMSVVQASSSGCVVNPPEEQVEFPPGKKCWYFQGIGTVFRVQLAAEQLVFVRMRGEENSEHLSPDVNGPNDFTKVQDEGDETNELEFQAPTSGIYYVSFSPCAAWGEVITVEICAK